MEMAKTLKKAGALILCLIMCLAIAVPTYASGSTAADKVAKYELGGEETKNFETPGTYDIKWDVYNYDSEPTTGVIITGVFNGAALESVSIGAEQTIASGTKQTLTNSVTLPDDGSGVTNRTLKSFLWKSMETMIPLGGAAPAAPTGVTTGVKTNSTVELSWDTPAHATPIAYYNVYRNDKFVGATFGNVTNFKDVGIEHSTTVTYTVTAVDFTGKESEKSVATTPVTTDAIARLYLGAAADKIASGETSLALTADNSSYITGNNVGNVHIVLGNGTTDGSLAAVSEDFVYTGTNKLGISALQIGPNSSRVQATISNEELLNALKADANHEMKVIMNRYDYTTSDSGTNGYDGGAGIKTPALIRYGVAEGSTSLAGAAGVAIGATQKWDTKIMTVPTLGNTKATSNSTSVYTNTFKDRFFDFKEKTQSGKNLTYTDGVAAMFSVANPSTLIYSYVSKVDIAGSNYVPYGAVLDFDKQEDTQFVGFLRRNGYNEYAIENVSDSNATVKKAAKLDSADNKTKRICFKLLSDYITESDNNFIIRVTYLDNKVDENNSDGLQVIYKNTNGANNGNNFIRRTGTGEWKTAEFFISDAKFTDAWDTFQLSVPGATGENAFCVSRVEIIKR